MKTLPLPDQSARNQIIASEMLHRNLLVEAAAGTGKTTSLVGRMVALIEGNVAGMETLAAMTFTRKAAAELRARFQIELEKRAQSATGEKQMRLQAAVTNLSRCFIGTIHSFCARLLRERPVEAGVDVAFKELDEATDHRLRRQAWREYVARLSASNAPLLGKLASLKIEMRQLEDAFLTLADYSDVADADWPCPLAPIPDLTGLQSKLEERIKRIRSLVDAHPGEDNHLLQRYRRILAMVRQVNWDQISEVMELVEEFKGDLKIPAGFLKGNSGKSERDGWKEFASEAALLLEAWGAVRYEPALRAILPARAVYDRLRQEEGGLNFQDLLLRAAALLKNHPEVRRYFRQRFSHLLVDEFQDTDPIQSEVILLLTASDPTEKNWRQCCPVPGSLFVVGDPKQSIYRFRRADIRTYEVVKKILQDNNGVLLPLSASFRSRPSLLDWTNGVFAPKFPKQSTPYSPAYVALQPTKADTPGISVTKLVWSSDLTHQNSIATAEAVAIAQVIFAKLQHPDYAAQDFLILARKNARLGIYAQALQQLGIPCEITGGATLNDTLEVTLLHLVLRAVVEPHNPLALVSALRSEVFGISDRSLYVFGKAGGQFNFRSVLPHSLDEDVLGPFREAWDRLRRYAGWLHHLPPVAAFERIAADLGLFARAMAEENGSVRAGSLCKALELLRAQQSRIPTVGELVKILENIVDPSEKDREEAYDGISVRPSPHVAVRIMNLHKAKGLEAAVVFLADPSGDKNRIPQIHIDRENNQTRGFLVVGTYDPYGNFRPLAHPADWGRWKGEEEQHEAAEKMRLLYVAATRAKEMLIVSLRESSPNKNPWEAFRSDLTSAPALEIPPNPVPVILTPQKLSAGDISDASAANVLRWQAVRQKSYETRSAKHLSPKKLALKPSAGESGTPWGTVIHILLQIAMAQPTADRVKVAEAALVEQEMDPALSRLAETTVRLVLRSAMWKRALRSQQCLVEVPFQRLISPVENSEISVPTILRGVIDLAFWEDDGWVIVDYKTDKGSLQSDLVAHYRPQVEVYADEWGRITGQKVKEKALFFTETGQYVEL